MTLTALDADDGRSITVQVAGVAALMIAKAHKLHDRSRGGRPDRLKDKDALDVLRLMRTSRPVTVGETLAQVVRHPQAGPATADGVRYLEQLFGRRGRPGIEMAVRAINSEIPAAEVEAICVAYTAALLTAADRSTSS